MPNTSYEVSRRYLLDEIIDFGKISNSFEAHSVSFMTILPPGIYTPADGQYVDMVFDKIVVDCQGDFIYYGNQDRLLEVYNGRGGGWIDQSLRDIEFLPDIQVGELFYQLLTECANNDDLPQPPRWQTSVKQIDLNKFFAEKMGDEFIAGQYHNVQVIAHSDNEYFDTSAPTDNVEFKATEPYDTNGGLYDENGVNIVSWDTLTEFYEMAIHRPTSDLDTGNPFWPQLESSAYRCNPNESDPDPKYYEPNLFWLGNIALTRFPEACTLVIPEGVTYVRDCLLANISLSASQLLGNDLNISKLYLPSTVREIGKNAFINSKITKIYYNGTAKMWSQIAFKSRYSNPCAAAHLQLIREADVLFDSDMRADIDQLFSYRQDRDNKLSPFRLLPDFYIKSSPSDSDQDYELLVEINVQGNQDEEERITISAYAFAGCGKYVEKIILNNAVTAIHKDAFDIFIATNTPASGEHYGKNLELLPLKFYYNGTLNDWLSTALDSRWSNPGYRARYIEFSDDEICGIDDEYANNQCPIETLNVSLDRVIPNDYAFTGWCAETLILNNIYEMKYRPDVLRKHMFFNSSFGQVIINDTPEAWSRIGLIDSMSANPLRNVDYSNVFFYDNDLNTLVQADTTLYVPQRATSVKAYKYAGLPIRKIYLPPSVRLVGRDSFFDCVGLELIDCTAYRSGLPKIRRPQTHPVDHPYSESGLNFISSPFTSRTPVSDRPVILIPRDCTGSDWEYLGSKSLTNISGEMHHWECCRIEHATSNLSTSTAINIKIYDLDAQISVRLKNIPGMTVDWGDGSFTYKHTTSQLTDSEYITHIYEQDVKFQRNYRCSARTIRIYDIDHIPSDFFELNTDMPESVGIATLTIANGIKSIGKNAFGNILNWDRLENIYISNTVLFIDQGAFGDYMRQDAFIVFEDADASTYPWYSTPQANTFTASDERLSIDPLSCFESYAESDGTSQNSGMLSAIMAEGKVLYRYSAAKSYTTKIRTAVNGYMIDNGSSIIYNYPGEAQISIGKGAKNITAECALGADECSVKHAYNQTTGILTLTISGTDSATYYAINYSYSLPDYQGD